MNFFFDKLERASLFINDLEKVGFERSVSSSFTDTDPSDGFLLSYFYLRGKYYITISGSFYPTSFPVRIVKDENYFKNLLFIEKQLTFIENLKTGQIVKTNNIFNQGVGIVIDDNPGPGQIMIQTLETRRYVSSTQLIWPKPQEVLNFLIRQFIDETRTKIIK